jgi:TRAP-type C4-dicarboxylate transport system substrate-binding protein
MEGAQLGTIDISYTNCGPLAQFVPSLNVVSLPYTFKSTDHMYKALESEAGQRLIEDINAAKFVHLTFFDSGSRETSSPTSAASRTLKT